MLSEAMMRALAAPFGPQTLNVKPGAVAADGKSALVLAYIDARAVMDRLDSAAPGEWEWRVDDLPEFRDKIAVKGSLTVCGVTREDVGQGGAEEEPYKSAVSDALKRCGVQFGIGRALYDMPKVWAPGSGDRTHFRFADERRLVGLVAELIAAMDAGDRPKQKTLFDQIRKGQEGRSE